MYPNRRPFRSSTSGFLKIIYMGTNHNNDDDVKANKIIKEFESQCLDDKHLCICIISLIALS